MAVSAPAADRIGEQLILEGLVSREQLAKALDEARSSSTRVGYSLVKLGFLSEQDLVRALARQHRIPAVDLERVKLDPRILKLIPAEIAVKHQVLPLRRVGRTLTVAMANPTDLGVLDDLKFVTRLDVEPVIAGDFSLRKIIEKEYEASDERINDLLKQIESEEIEVMDDREEEMNVSSLQAAVEEAPVVKLINGILTDAVHRGASDIHFECYEKDIRVRYRVDGVLLEIMRPPMKMKAALISRFKILSDLNIAERRVPQDGRIKLRLGKRVIDFRVSTLPTLFGEKIVLRILDKGNLTLDLEKFGMEERAEKNFMRAIMNPYGMVLVTGPTGSGKTTTLYSALSKINTPEVNIMTAEDPVEYNLHGINQVQVRTEIGMTFSAALKAFLRQDPNIIMVGEIRDLDTGSIAIKAALTGHLVLSTLHTNDAPSTITRMIDMGIEPFNVASAVNLITAQRLLRRICGNCKEPTTYPADYLRAAGLTDEEIAEAAFFKGAGCDTCGGSGYKGRAGLYEVMAMSPTLRRMVLQSASTADLQKQAISEGMLTLRMDGMLKARRGVTTLEEVFKETAA
ncbi:type IV-A pilus assembly ATPase PilB [Longimicrobium terrae]|uniref:Type IV pilus assembly protein PilB n=1 Tax=Longimicrobium terrae TaxID=1639882 RepID=A0A841H1M7_9BACT|nr:type IV-A pilus assembly ATPase PilB [Longimicrobium terrae]MBB4637476.1 type IV pilus assembly protein PilB [Longimicrobium terrae]MBB6071874.1 type IV pilus assembly protein PilB [Longimicrobium terrae]NNC30422.1 type IV-A pilus assembly ATPase PilB [Longimicrobium terrae]